LRALLLTLLLACFFLVEKTDSFEDLLPEGEFKRFWGTVVAIAVPITVAIAVVIIVVATWAAVATVTLFWFLCIRHVVYVLLVQALAMGYQMQWLVPFHPMLARGAFLHRQCENGSIA
jgi:uncharacterized membrane protein YciS (DUF1049 family)